LSQIRCWDGKEWQKTSVPGHIKNNIGFLQVPDSWGLSFNAGLQECLRTTNWDKHGRAGLNQHWRGVDLKHLETSWNMSMSYRLIGTSKNDCILVCKNNSPCFYRFRSSLRWPIVVTHWPNWSHRVPQRPMMTAFCLPDSTAVVTFMDTPIAGGFKIGVPSVKQPRSNGKSLFLLGKSTISMASF